VTHAIFKDIDDENGDERKDTTGELCNIIAGTIATELDNNYPVSVPRHINQEEAAQYIASSAVISEILLLSKQQPFYIVLTTPESV